MAAAITCFILPSHFSRVHRTISQRGAYIRVKVQHKDSKSHSSIHEWIKNHNTSHVSDISIQTLYYNFPKLFWQNIRIPCGIPWWPICLPTIFPLVSPMGFNPWRNPTGTPWRPVASLSSRRIIFEPSPGAKHPKYTRQMYHWAFDT